MATQHLKILGYSDEICAAPGEKIEFKVSCDGPGSYRADIVRIIHGDCNPIGPGFKEKVVKTPVSRTYKGRKQVINAGSYAVIPGHPVLDALESFTVQAMIWPTTPDKGEQALIAKWSETAKAGFQLIIDKSGAIALRLGDGKGKSETISAGKALLKREWYFVGASYDAKSKKVVIHQEPFVEYPRIDDKARLSAKSKLRRIDMGASPLTMAAIIRRTAKARHRTSSHYNGKIDSPRLANRALDRAAMGDLQQPPIATSLRAAVVGAWDFSLDIPTQEVTDISDNNLHGEVVNLPTRAMTGYNWSYEVWNWADAPQEYGAIHFHDDDLYDAGWETDFTLTVPAGLKSGCYAARLRSGKDEDYIPFYVRPPRGTATSKVLFLAPMCSYMAYANRMRSWLLASAELLACRLHVIQPWEQHLNENPEIGGSLYDHHSDGSGICYSSRLRPILNFRPKVMMAAAAHGSMLWQYNADTHLTDWLEHEGFDFDALTDEELHTEGLECLKPYNVVITGTHPEYYSGAMLDAVKAYTDLGGRFMYMGGNGLYWHTCYHPELPGVVEVRRAEGGTRAWKCEPGEYYHASDGRLGGLWRFQNRPPQKLVGTGFISQGFDLCTYYRRTPHSFDPRVKFVFEGIGKDELIGDFGLLGNGAAGIEIDVADFSLGTPPHALIVASSEDLTDSYLITNEQHIVATPNNFGDSTPINRADLVFFETPHGGAVFAFSSIAWCGSLSHNYYKNNVSRLTGNVVRRFAGSKPL